jgi:Kdo2-lipid IVA lauroyltransferase/acyltransferase
VKSLLSSALLTALYLLLGGAAQLLRLCRWQRGLIERHVDRCLPGLPPERRHRVVTGFYRYLGELAAEILAEPFLDRESLRARVRLDNAGALTALLQQQRRVLILTAHHANWEWLLLRCSVEFEQPLTAVYKRISTPWADRLALRLRQRFGCRMVTSRQIVPHLLEQRGQVRLLAMLADQSPAARNDQQVWMDFFDQPTAFYAGPGWIAAKFNFTPYFAAVRREGRGRYVVHFTELAPPGTRMEPEQVLGAYVRALEEHVRQYPEQYLWAYNRWKREKPLYG